MTAIELTKARMPLFVQTLEKELPSADLMVLYPLPKQRAATIYVRIKHTDARRKCHYPSSGGAYNQLSDDEKNAIGEAVGKAAFVAEVEALFKPSASLDYEVCYRVFVPDGR